jgi:hypothetical protein
MTFCKALRGIMLEFYPVRGEFSRISQDYCQYHQDKALLCNNLAL